MPPRQDDNLRLDPIAHMSQRQGELVELFQEHRQELSLLHKKFDQMDTKVGTIVTELPRLRWAAYGALIISLVTALFVGWLYMKLQPVLRDDVEIRLR